MMKWVLVAFLVALGSRGAHAAWVQLNSTGVVVGYAAVAAPVPSTGWTQVANDDARLTAFLSAQQNASSALASFATTLGEGITITSTGTPALNGTYPLDDASRADIVAVQTSINAGEGLPLGRSSVAVSDMSGAPHSFTAAQFTPFAAAERDCYVTLLGLKAQASAGASVTWSPCAATIP